MRARVILAEVGGCARMLCLLRCTSRLRSSVRSSATFCTAAAYACPA